ncbi:unnamed protein product [Schistocephalus solidus]|uniref:Integron gene cassette protein n=1 Tax=Schistocephalus solidus TaxID=70667 RepID=A0A183SFK0_SCHSO|nr:unnamed protein product [Schistocephalus solidus]
MSHAVCQGLRREHCRAGVSPARSSTVLIPPRRTPKGSQVSDLRLKTFLSSRREFNQADNRVRASGDNRKETA